MTEREKMTAGMLYDPTDSELDALRLKARKLARQFNATDEDQIETYNRILRELLPNSRELPMLQAPVWFDYGINTTFGKNCCANFNFTCLDVGPVRIGDNVFIGPNVTIATPMHPMLPEERNVRTDPDGRPYNLEYARPVTIEQNCWIAANVIICGGVTVEEGCVIGAGSVVTRDIPAHHLAAGNPCRVIRKLTEKDRIGEGIHCPSQTTSKEENREHGTAELRTQRLILRRYTADDAKALYRELGTDPDMTKYSGWNPYATLQMAEETVSRFMEGYEDDRTYSWVIDSKGALIGTIGAYDFADGRIEVGFSIANSFWGQGYATEALKKVLEYLTENEGILCVTAWCAGENTGSRKVMEKAGMQLTGTQRGGLEIANRVYDRLVFEYRKN